MMKGLVTRHLFARFVIACAVCLHVQALRAQPNGFDFGVIANLLRSTPDETTLGEIIADTDRENLAFIVVNGIKASNEPCSDAVYMRRKTMLDSAKNGMIVSLAGSDWIDCRDSRGRVISQERLNRLRELFYGDEFSFGSSRIPVMRQSTSPKFRSYAENMRWEVGNTMFATLDLPAENNHYRKEAGRNSEFEDRLIANHEWMQRIFTFATRKRFDGVVLFCDGDPLTEPGLLERIDPRAKRDGFLETRRDLLALARKFPGKVLVVFSQTTEPDNEPANTIRWQANIGKIGVRAGWIKLHVDNTSPSLFSLATSASDMNATQ
jgi:hypothetical protein